jgi:hypothetical protein
LDHIKIIIREKKVTHLDESVYSSKKNQNRKKPHKTGIGINSKLLRQKIKRYIHRDAE